MFGKYVGWILLSVDFAQVHTLGSDGLLNPKRVCVEVAQLAKALPVAYADGSAGIRPHAQRQLDTCVAQERLVSEALAGPSNNSGELRFA